MNLYLASYLLCIGFKKMFRKLLKILNQQDPPFFCFIGAMVGVPLPTFFAVFRRFFKLFYQRNIMTKYENSVVSFSEITQTLHVPP